MLKAFLDQKFGSLQDLGSLDSVISQIESDKDALKEQVTGKSTDIYEEQGKQLIQILDSIVDQDNLDAVDDLIEKHGNIEILTSFRQELVKKLVLKEVTDLYNAYLSLNDNLNDFELLDLPKLKSDEAIKQLQRLGEQLQRYEKTSVYYPSAAESHKEYIDLLHEKYKSIAAGELRDRVTKEFQQHITHWDEEGKLKASEVGSLKLYFDRVVKLQSVYNKVETAEPETIWAFDCLASNFKVKFVYHFEGSNETNRLDKPEYPLNYLQGYIKKTAPLFESLYSLQFSKYYPKLGAVKCFILSLMTPIKEKFDREMHLVTNDEGLLSHLILELQKFDQFLVKTYKFNQLGDEGTKLLTYKLVLSNNDVFDRWLNNEKNFVNHRYEEIMNSKDAFEIDEDFVEDGKTKPTKSAINLKNLLEGISNNYAMLPTKFQVKFLSEVQLRLLNSYFSSLKQGFNALDAIIHAKISDEISALERICRVWCSSKYIIETMTNWGESILFIELWSSINGNSRLETTFFESVISGYKKDLMVQLPRKLQTYFERELNKTMKSYFLSSQQWGSIGDGDVTGARELDLPIATLRKDLGYLRKVVSYGDFLNIELILSGAITAYFEKNVIYCNRFSIGGAKQLEADYTKMYQSLNLLRDNSNYGKTSEILIILTSNDQQQLLSSSSRFQHLNEYQVSELVARRK